MNLVVAKDPEELAERAATEFARIAKESINERGAFSVALSGGSTPILLYRRLIDAQLDWGKAFFFFGDERNVSPDKEASNFRSANKELFRPLRIREDRIFRWRTEFGEPERIADDYSHRLAEGFGEISGNNAGENIPLGSFEFDLILLGMGSDGHTASLFPGTEALNETERSTAANWVPQLGSWRFTLTFPVINHARNVIFLVAGADKADTLRAVIEGEQRPDELPAQRIQPTDGTLTWFADHAAASKLSDINI